MSKILFLPSSLKISLKNKIFFILLICSIAAHAQTTYEPLYNDIYPFLSRLAQKGIIQLDDQIKPLSRKYIAEKLTELDSLKDKLTNLEQEELEFFEKDFYTEINFKKITEINSKKISFLKKDNGGRFRFFSYGDNLFKLNADPILGFQTGTRDSKLFNHYWTGLSFYGYLSDFIGFSFDYRDNHEWGKSLDTAKLFTPVTGIIPTQKSSNALDYSEIHTTISVDWNWGTFTAGKDFLEWGYGESGKLVLSDKAPSFPFIRLDIYPVPWLRFNYFHGWLSSDVIDSAASYSTLVPGLTRLSYRSKYIASHTITVTPLQGLDISLGESIIYSDKLQISYLFPLMFFKLADHYLSNYDNNIGDNSQFFLGISSRNHIKNTHLYGTLFIDEISLTNLFNSKPERNQIGYTLGGSVVDIPVSNSTFTIEYTKIYPFVYQHFIPTDTYQNDSYYLGHWMGNNGDLVYSSFKYRFIRGLQVSVWGQYIRKGGMPDPKYGWSPVTPPTLPYPNFLSGLRTNYLYGGFDIKYEIINNLFARFNLQTTKIKSEVSRGTFNTKALNEFYFYL
ncbi:MAG: capsule assembly Wzi family protein, partial [Ignavibacteriaceae bacterium]